jgi:alkanesulfonate monooxygenase SsuD/methylene tetrahydromethanopterin reductase-like flavin-dependent oxidoreductase (luciferase family)
MREHAYMYVNLPAYANSLRHAGLGDEVDGVTHGDERSLDALVDALCACGDAQRVRAKLAEFAKAGLDELVVYPVPFGDDPASSVLHTLRALAP